MVLQRHHKVIIGGVSFLLIVFMITSSLFTYMIFTKQATDVNDLNKKITNLQIYTQTKFDDLSNNLTNAKTELDSLGTQVGSINKNITNLKASLGSDFSDIFANAVKSVVVIVTNTGQGSGFVIANGGYIVTNAHVIEGATAAVAITYDGQQHRISKVGENSLMDIALLKMDSSNYNPLELGNSDNVVQSERVIAIGNAEGTGFSVTQGSVSNIHKAGENGLNIYIQIDAALNPGNSGGPLVDANGKVIGMNTFKIANTESMGFALESNYIKQIVNTIPQQIEGKNLI
ncbi:MAG: trypsin-like peptidase domain-containing protein [Nanoarchaeota archaeon]